MICACASSEERALAAVLKTRDEARMQVMQACDEAKQQIISADYSMNVAQSQNNSQLQNIVKNLNGTNSSSSRNFVN